MAWQSFQIEKYEACSVAYNNPGYPKTPDAVELLRNEKPVFFQWSDNAGARLSIGQETVGEEEPS